MSVRTSSATFVYGRFVWPGRAKELLPPLPGSEDFAIEVLREYSSQEFLGKLYRRRFVQEWSPIAATGVASYDWYKWFSKKQQHLYFEMEGSGFWEVVNFRNESDESGPYVAVALKYSPHKSLPKWVSANLP